MSTGPRRLSNGTNPRRLSTGGDLNYRQGLPFGDLCTVLLHLMSGVLILLLLFLLLLLLYMRMLTPNMVKPGI